ncbi:hypothetical protein ACFOMD_01965 [Sphingoaurantiacus capsulatus]|uniref:Uncharacterized protein n=1 Tax=Sphingoaurantiacus capsulatus TaxID=1771310 RepID=A0ABV7X7W0_9SPHN
MAFYPPAVAREDAAPLAAAARAYATALAPAEEGVRVRLLTMLALRFPVAASLSDAEAAARMNLLIDDLAHLPADLLDLACRRAALSSRFMPTAAELIGQVREEMGERQRRLYRLDRLAREAGRAAPRSRPITDNERAKVAAGLAKLARRLGRSTTRRNPQSNKTKTGD